jgi:hypothetical protein
MSFVMTGPMDEPVEKRPADRTGCITARRTE